MSSAFPQSIMLLLLVTPVVAQQQQQFDSVSTLIAAGKLLEAQQALKQLDPALPQTAHLTGVVNFNLRDYKQALGDFERAMRGETKDGPAYRESSQLLGRSLFLLGRGSDALPWLEHAWQVGERGAEVLYMLGNAYIDKQNPNGARFAFADLYGIDRSAPAAFLITAKMMVRRNARESAGKQLELALIADPKLPGAHYLAAEMAAAKSDFATSTTELKKEIEIQPDHSASYSLLGEVMLKSGQLDTGIDALRRAVWLNPYQIGPYLLLGQAYLAKSDLSNAEGVLRRAAQGDPDNQSCLELLAKTLRLEGKPDEAKLFETRARQLQHK